TASAGVLSNAKAASSTRPFRVTGTASGAGRSRGALPTIDMASSGDGAGDHGRPALSRLALEPVGPRPGVEPQGVPLVVRQFGLRDHVLDIGEGVTAIEHRVDAL